MRSTLPIRSQQGATLGLMTNKEALLEQVKAMSEEEAAQVKLVFAPDWPTKATLIDEVRQRSSTAPLSPEDFERHFGDLPSDGEG